MKTEGEEIFDLVLSTFLPDEKKTSFVYVLIDPLISKTINGIFYIGKGMNARHYQHLKDAKILLLWTDYEYLLSIEKLIILLKFNFSITSNNFLTTSSKFSKNRTSTNLKYSIIIISCYYYITKPEANKIFIVIKV